MTSLSRAGLKAQQTSAGELNWYASIEELYAYRELLEVGKALQGGDAQAAVVRVDQCWKILASCGVKNEEVAYGLSIYCVVAICYETRQAKGMVKSCECCGRVCEAKKSRPCKQFVTQIRPADYEWVINSMEAIYGLFGITRRHIDAVCSVAAKKDEAFAKWYQDEYLETEKIQKETCHGV